MNQQKSSGWAPDASDTTVDEPTDTVAEPTIFGLVQRVVTDGRNYAETELERQKMRVTILGAAGRDTALIVVSALFLLFGALTTLLIGCVWVLAPLIGVIAALALILLIVFGVILILLVAARARMRNALRIAFGKEEAE